MKTILYIDGFNLYYGALRKTPFRWLDPIRLARQAFPKNRIVGTKYFSAKVDPAIGDPQAPVRQAIYWRALKTLPLLEIIEGQFRTRRSWAKVASPPPEKIEVLKNEEKGSDVNLASYLLLDAFQNKFQAAIVISGDSDLFTPIRMVKDQLSKPVGVLNSQRLSGPHKPKERKNAGLRRAASFYKKGVTWAQLERSQFPDSLRDKTGPMKKPSKW
ncbi:MAG: NYN domain-containing protein [Verrucomicrobiota bacterium]